MQKVGRRGLHCANQKSALAWLALHLIFLIGFRNKITVIIQWIYSYLAYKRGARIITNIPLEKKFESKQ